VWSVTGLWAGHGGPGNQAGPLGTLAGLHMGWASEDAALPTPPRYEGAWPQFAVCGLLGTRAFEKFFAHLSVLNPATLMKR